MKVEFDLPFICIILSMIFQSISALFGKQAALMIADFSALNVATNSYYILSLLCLVLQALTWQVALRKYPLSFAYFITSILPINILLISHFVFHEPVSPGNIIGGCIIVTGLIFLTRNGKQKSDA